MSEKLSLRKKFFFYFIQLCSFHRRAFFFYIHSALRVQGVGVMGECLWRQHTDKPPRKSSDKNFILCWRSHTCNSQNILNSSPEFFWMWKQQKLLKSYFVFSFLLFLFLLDFELRKSEENWIRKEIQFIFFLSERNRSNSAINHEVFLSIFLLFWTKDNFSFSPSTSIHFLQNLMKSICRHVKLEAEGGSGSDEEYHEL